MNEKMNYRKYIPAVIIIIMVGLIIHVALNGDSKQSGRKQSSEAVKTPTSTDNGVEKNYDKQILAVVKQMDTESKTITIFDINNQTDITLTYTGSSDIRDKYDKVLSMKQIAMGEMVDAFYMEKDSRLVSLHISKEAWEYQGVGNLSIDNINKSMSISDTNYQYNEKIIIVNNNELINLIDLNEKDELTVKGTEGKIWSIIVTKGHGYVRFTNFDDFIGGSLEIGNQFFIDIAEDMLVVIREGSYKLTMENDGLEGSKMVQVDRDQEVTIDMGEFRKEADKISTVEFDIKPNGADLYIDGELKDYSDPIELEYGKHVIKVTLTGYNDFTGEINVDRAGMQYSINLAEPKESLEDETTNTDSNSGSSNNTNSTSGTNTNQTGEDTNQTNPEDGQADASNSTTDTNSDTIKKEDTSHKIYIEAPSGATVYWDGILKGTVPISFTKTVGNYTVTLSQDGYATKSYPVGITDNGEDVYLNFPSMSKQ